MEHQVFASAHTSRHLWQGGSDRGPLWECNWKPEALSAVDTLFEANGAQRGNSTPVIVRSITIIKETPFLAIKFKNTGMKWESADDKMRQVKYGGICGLCGQTGKQEKSRMENWCIKAARWGHSSCRREDILHQRRGCRRIVLHCIYTWHSTLAARQGAPLFLSKNLGRTHSSWHTP